MRAYQADFYNLSERVRDRDSRLRQADKIRYVLTNLTHYPLSIARCLDLGCASGVITAALSPLVASIVGLDYDAVALQHVEREGELNMAFVRGDGLHLPYPDSTFDLIICTQVYEHVPDDRHLVPEMQRVLKPGGIVFFSGPNWLFPIEPHYFLPFLHWLPSPLADRYLHLFYKSSHYYERSRTLWGLRRLLAQFTICDVTIEVLRYRERMMQIGLSRFVPRWIWQILLPFYPNFNWILIKPERLST